MATQKSTAVKKTEVKRPTPIRSRAARPEDRVPVGGMRDVLTVYGLREDLEYRWVRDTDEDGPRIFEFNRGGWDFVQSKDVKVGQAYVYETSNIGSIVRQPSKDGGYLFLMFISKELYDEDFAEKMAKIAEKERALSRPKEDEGQYIKQAEISAKLGKQGEDENLKG